jgi:hypothetical protein
MRGNRARQPESENLGEGRRKHRKIGLTIRPQNFTPTERTVQYFFGTLFHFRKTGARDIPNEHGGAQAVRAA